MSVSDKPDAKPDFHEVPVGTDLGSIEYEVGEKMVRRHVQATHQPPYPAQGGHQLGPVSILSSDGLRLVEPSYDLSEAVHAGQRLEVINPPIVGSHVTVTGKLAEKFEKAGRHYLIIETVSEDDQGRLLAHGRTVVVARYRP
jgi:hypothetical protein